MAYLLKINTRRFPLHFSTLIFVVFVFLYLYNYQSDTLTYVQHVLSNGKTHYNSVAGGIIITLISYIIVLLQQSFSKVIRRFRFIALYLPSLLIAFLCNVDKNVSFNFYLLIIGLLLYALVLYWLKDIVKQSNDHYTPNFTDTLLFHLIYLIVLFFSISMIGNNDEVFHYRLRTERYILDKKYELAIKVGDRSSVADSSLTMLRAFALNKEHLLGEKLFTYNIIGGSSVLLPIDSNSCLLLSQTFVKDDMKVRTKDKISALKYFQKLDELRVKNKQYADYLLCAYLMDKRLDDFIRTLPKYYVINNKLPKHYREALLVYSHTHTTSVIEFHDNVMEADYQDYAKLEKQLSNNIIRKNKLKEVFGNTYWYYYQYVIS
ncbi:MAG: DUF6057 family protein [Prevotella sp.]